MPTSAPDINPRATEARVEGRRLVVDLVDGRSIVVPIKWFPKLEQASSDQLRSWRLVGGGLGIHWPDLDEDLSVAGMLRTEPLSKRSFERVAATERLAASASLKRAAGDWIAHDQSGQVTRYSTARLLREGAINRLEHEIGRVRRLEGTRAIYIANAARLNLRTATKKRSDAYWFDVTPAYYEYDIVDFFTYVCGAPENLFVFSREEMADLASQAHRGGDKNVPNFTLHVSTKEFEPAGAGGRRVSVMRQWNALGRIRNFAPVA